MNRTTTLFALFTPILLNAQLLNGSFELNGSPSTAHWQDLCYSPQSIADPAPSSGEFAIKQDYGNSQGCFPSFVYQEVPAMQDGQVWTVSGWAKTDSLWAPTNVGIFLGKVSGPDLVSTNSGAWTNATEWTYLTKTDTVRLQPGQTGAVVLMSGMVPGPLYGFGLFDGIMAHDQISTQVAELEPADINLFPSPAVDVLYVGAEGFTANVDLQVYDLTGQVEQEHVGMPALHGTTVKLDISTLKPGLHVIQATDGIHVLTKRFYKQ